MNKPVVDSKQYSKEYFMDAETYGGAKEFGAGIYDRRFHQSLERADIHSGMKVLDVGCGKGEMTNLCSASGAESIGIDYSEDAIDIAVQYKHKFAKFVLVKGFMFPFQDGTFDRVTMLDIAEHLSKQELQECLKEVKRVLKPNGMLYLDTSPNKLFNEITYYMWERPLNMLINKMCGTKFMVRYPIRTETDLKLHINEHTVFSIRQALKGAGYRVTTKMHPRKVTPRKMGNKKMQFLEYMRCIITCLYPVSCIFPLNLLFCNDIICFGRTKHK